jgi:Ankyrin repeats (3 copies)/Ankyrin repeat
MQLLKRTDATHWALRRDMSKTPFAIRHLACAAKIGDANTACGILRQSSTAARDWRPIMEASYNGFPEVVELLVKHGANVNAVSTSEHNRPLHRAAEKNHLDVIEVLLRLGADIESRATWLQITPLVKAAFDGHSRIVDFLLEHGASVDAFLPQQSVGLEPQHMVSMRTA